jgi:hypothetical protein
MRKLTLLVIKCPSSVNSLLLSFVPPLQIQISLAFHSEHDLDQLLLNSYDLTKKCWLNLDQSVLVHQTCTVI